LRKLSRFDEAQKLIDGLLAENKLDPDILELAVYNALDQGNQEQAYAYAKRLAAEAGSRSEAGNFLVLGDIFYRLGDWPSAVQWLNRYHQTSAGEYYSHFILGNCLLSLGEKDLSRREYERALTLIQALASPSLAQELDQVMILNRLQQPEAALALLQKIFTRNPQNVEVLSALADYYRNNKELQAARQYLEEIYHQQPDNADVLLALAGIYYELNDLPRASELAARLPALKAETLGAYYLLGNIYLAQGRDFLARRQFRLALERDQKHPDNSVAGSVTRTDILWRLGRRAAARSNLAKLLRDYPQEPAVLNTAFYIYIDDNSLKRARNILKRFAAVTADSDRLLEMEGALLVKEARWQAAEKVFTQLLAKGPAASFRRTYADILAKENKWPDAKENYDRLWRQNKSLDDLRSRRLAVAEGDPQAGITWSYLKRPQAQRDYIVTQDALVWVSPRLRLSGEVSEEKYTREGQEGQEGIDQFVVTDFLEGKYIVSDNLEVAARWTLAQHDDRDYNGGILAMNWDTGIARSLWSFEGNRFVRDPIEAIAKGATWNHAETSNRWQVNEKWSLGLDLDNYWYYVDPNTNTVNGGRDLGYKWVYEPFVEYALLSKPLVSIGYHFKRGHWQKDFPEADQVVGYLPEEMAHFGTFYTEQSLGEAGDLIFTVSSGYDVKRDTPFTVFYLEPKLWLRENLQLRGSYEYDLGDSGTAGKGDSQIFKLFVTLYF